MKQKMNVIWSERAVYERATAYFDQVSKRSFAWDTLFNEVAARQAINNLENVGTFEPSWGEHASRPPQYFDLYEPNIRVWNPWYQETIRRCCKAVKREVLARYNTRPSIRLLEVGVGTGGLTRPLLKWISVANELASHAQHGSFVERYYGIDSAQQMLDRIPDDISENELCAFSLGRYGRGNIRRALGDCNADMIFGSLVLHDILDRDLAKTVPLFFEVAKDCLTDKGSLVFADILFSSDDAVRAKEMGCWKRRMKALGMEEAQVKTFLDCNPEMVETATVESLNDAGGRHGFAPAEVQYIPEPKEDYIPFKIITMRRK